MLVFFAALWNQFSATSFRRRFLVRVCRGHKRGEGDTSLRATATTNN